MKRSTPIFLLVVLSCSRTAPAPTTQTAPPVRGAPARNDVRAIADGEPTGLRLEDGALTFCDRRGPRTLDLKTGQDGTRAGACGKSSEANTACSGLGVEVIVRAPANEPNDVLDVDGSSFPLTGRVHDCAAQGKLLAVVTAAEVVLVDSAKSAFYRLANQGADRVTTAFGWVAWSQGSKLRATRQPAATATPK